MVSQNLRNKAYYQLHKERKKTLLDDVSFKIKNIERNSYMIGLIHNDNILLPEESIESTGEDKYIFNQNNIYITRKIEKMSSNLKYKIIIAFNEETFKYFNLEHIRSTSLVKYIREKVIYRILEDLYKTKRKTELALKIVEPNEEEAHERRLRTLENEDYRKKKRIKREKAARQEVNVQTNYLREHTKEEKVKKWKDLEKTNLNNFKKQLSFINVTINHVGMLVVKPTDKKPKISELFSNRTIENNKNIDIFPVIDSHTSIPSKKEKVQKCYKSSDFCLPVLTALEYFEED